MGKNDFLELQPCEFYAINFKYLEQLKFKEQGEWERTRWQTTMLVNCHVKSPLKPTDLIVFSWEKTPENSHGLTKKKIEELKQKWNLNNG